MIFTEAQKYLGHIQSGYEARSQKGKEGEREGGQTSAIWTQQAEL